MTEKNYPDLDHSLGVWNLPHKFHLYLIYWLFNVTEWVLLSSHGKINLDWLNLSYNSYKVRCKKLFLSWVFLQPISLPSHLAGQQLLIKFQVLTTICQAHLLANFINIPLMYNFVLWNRFLKKIFFWLISFTRTVNFFHLLEEKDFMYFWIHLLASISLILITFVSLILITFVCLICNTCCGFLFYGELYKMKVIFYLKCYKVLAKLCLLISD